MTDQELITQFKLNNAIREAEMLGSWIKYALHYQGDCDTGDEALDVALGVLYSADWVVHSLANKLALRYDVTIFGD